MASKKPILLGAAALGLLVLFAGRKEAEASPPSAFTPNPAAEATACASAVAQKPTEHAGVAQGDVGELEWLARVAFHMAYGAWPDEDDPIQVQRLAALITCVQSKLAPPLGNLPPPPPQGELLEFDLTTNWGGLPLEVREPLARIELASGIPGIARALGVKAWQAWRAGQPLVTTAQAAALAAANPDLCRLCFNPDDGGPSGTLLKKNTDPKPGGNGWPKPVDYAGWAAGSYGLFDILGATAVHSGIHQGFTPLVSAISAASIMRTWTAQGFAAAYYIWRLLYGDLKVLDPGPNAPNGDSFDTWANIFTAWATPEGFKNNTPGAQAARGRYLDRAAEIGIDLSDVAYPWPPGMSYAPAVWQAKVVWQKLQDYAGRPVVEA
jgi:hypothetical protein